MYVSCPKFRSEIKLFILVPSKTFDIWSSGREFFYSSHIYFSAIYCLLTISFIRQFFLSDDNIFTKHQMISTFFVIDCQSYFLICCSAAFGAFIKNSNGKINKDY